jgi:hypothetical protein
MTLHLCSKHATRSHSGALIISSRILALVVYIGILAALPAFAQQMGSKAIYSDAWVNTSGSGSVVGCGVTQDSYNSYGHTYWVETKLTSPKGRTTTATSYKTNSYSAYTRVEVSLLWDWADLGGFSVESKHIACCSYMGGNPYTGANCYPSVTRDAVAVGASSARYKFDIFSGGTICRYQRYNNCRSTCARDYIDFTKQGSCYNYAQEIRGYGEVGGVRFCLPLVYSRRQLNTPDGMFLCCDGKIGTGGTSLHCEV